MRETLYDKKPIITHGEFDALFQNITAIHELTQSVLRKLQDKIAQEPSSTHVADIFTEIAVQKELFLTYSRGINAALEVYNNINKGKEFAVR